MKKYLFSLVAFMLMSVTSALAQTSLVATLSHDGKLSTYYGPDALSEAYEDAVDGDVITLSSGNFKTITVSKAITIRGAGMEKHDEALPTIIYNDDQSQSKPFQITDIPNKKSLQIEGIRFEAFVKINDDYSNHVVSDVKFLKCKFNYSTSLSSTTTSFINCKIMSGLSLSESTFHWAYVNAINCIIGSSNSGNGLFAVDHCVMLGNYEYLWKAIITNSIFTNASSYCIDNDCVVSDCLGVESENDNRDYFADISTSDENRNQMVYGYEKVFKTFKGNADGSEAYELTDEAAAKYLGSDGTQVGIYGGSMPFDPVPSSAQVKRFSVKTSEKDNGNISVTINVE